MKNLSKRVAVGMSGGVDSSTTAYLLQQQGYDVIGVSAWLLESGGKCCEKAIVDAARVCEYLGIEYYTIDLRDQFQNIIIDYFLKTYAVGKTPNPCVLCNKEIKWGALYKYVKENLNCELIATGHYAAIEELSGSYKIKRPLDRHKDQTYMLVSLTQEDLSHTLFPLGYYEKYEVKKIARENNIPTADNEESQDVCFVLPPETVQSYLEMHLGEKPGDIVDCSTGSVIGQHQGVYRYTIGQRKGIKVAYPYPLFVVSVDTEKNILYVGAREDMESTNLIASDVNWISGQVPEDKFFALTKIRYNSQPQLAQIELIEDTTVNVAFEEPVFAITPGQVVAFYSLDNQYLIGGGWIQ